MQMPIHKAMPKRMHTKIMLVIIKNAVFVMHNDINDIKKKLYFNFLRIIQNEMKKEWKKQGKSEIKY